MSNYWQDRSASAQNKLTNRSAREVEKQITKYYRATMERTIADFEKTYNKILDTVGKDKEPTPADLYKLDKYWQMQGQLSRELQKLGHKQIAALSKKFELNFFLVYHSIAIPGASSFNTVSKETVQQILSQIWCADGKSWSQRIWENVGKLKQELNDGLIHCIISGNTTSELKKVLQERFNVSYGRADALVRTELAHIQTQAAQKRYEDYGVEMVEIWADADERRCDICKELHQKRLPITAQMPIPAHPRCRCCVLPVVE